MFQLLVISKSVYSIQGLAVKDSNLNFSNNSIEPHKKSALLGDEYFRGMNAFINSPQRKGFIPSLIRSPGTAGAVFGTR